MQNHGHHSENRCGDKQNKKTVGFLNCRHHLENRCGGKQNKTVGVICAPATVINKNIGDVYS